MSTCSFAGEPRTRRPLRIAMVTTFYPPYSFGGDGQYIYNLAHAVARRGHIVDVVCDADAYRVLDGRADVDAPASAPGVTVHVLRSALPVLSCLATQQLGRPLVHGRSLRRLLANRFDVVHFHNVSLVGGPGVLAYGSGVKLYTAHEHWLVCPAHTLWRHNREICTGRQCVRCALAYKRPPQLWRASRLLARQARHIDSFIALSRFSADKHAEFGFTQTMTVMPSFLPDLPPGLPAAPETEGRPYFLFAGRLERMKGLQDVIPLFDGHCPADLLIAGTGTFETELRDLARGRPNVRFLGHCSPDQLHALYKGARALISPSVGFEVFPLTVLEAFQHGIPVIARRTGPYPEIIEASGGGLLFQNAAELAVAIAAFAADAAKPREMGETGRRAFRARWSETVALTAYLELIRSVAARRGLNRVSEAFEAPT